VVRRRSQAHAATGIAIAKLLDAREMRDIAEQLQPGIKRMPTCWRGITRAHAQAGRHLRPVLKVLTRHGDGVAADGVLEILQDGFGFLRTADASPIWPARTMSTSRPARSAASTCAPATTSPAASVRPRKASATSRFAQGRHINGEPPEASKNKALFENLTAAVPAQGFRLERGNGSTEDITGRILDLVAPIGRGQRGLIVSQPKAGKTMMLQNVAQAIVHNHPDVHLIVLLDRRASRRSHRNAAHRARRGVSSTFDEPAARHVQVAEMVIERAKRLVEHKKDVVILLDSITRLARAYNTVMPVIRQGADRRCRRQCAAAPEAFLRRRAQRRGRRFADHHRHRAGRHRLEDGRGDLRGVQGHRQHGSAPGPPHRREARLSGDQHQPLRYPPRGIADRTGLLQKIWILRKLLHPMDELAAMEFLLDKMKNTKSNDEFFTFMKR
jgi:transcription termination factor Rho